MLNLICHPVSYPVGRRFDTIADYRAVRSPHLTARPVGYGDPTAHEFQTISSRSAFRHRRRRWRNPTINLYSIPNSCRNHKGFDLLIFDTTWIPGQARDDRDYCRGDPCGRPGRCKTCPYGGGRMALKARTNGRCGHLPVTEPGMTVGYGDPTAPENKTNFSKI